MKSNWQRMIDGEPYCFEDAELAEKFNISHKRQMRFNTTGEGLDELLPNVGRRVVVVAPFSCDYGVNITIGDDVMINSGCTFLDCAPISIGSHVLIGPGVRLCAASHPTNYLQRREWEIAGPIVIGDDVWLGAGVIVCPGVTIGARSVAAAGAVITKDVPEDTLVAGNPAVVKKQLK